jgi:hypothetical protein
MLEVSRVGQVLQAEGPFRTLDQACEWGACVLAEFSSLASFSTVVLSAGYNRERG